MNPTTQEIRDRLNIVDVISSYIQVKKAGANYKATCPFHNEKSASLMISPSKQIWHCFGCGEGGDVFGFVMRYENLDFREALKILADRAGVKLPAYSGENAEVEKRKELLLRINAAAAKYYAQVLQTGNEAQTAREYLKDRGLSKETIADWQIGFSPRSSHALESFFKKKGVTAEEFVESGIGVKSERGYYDRFFNRITFPIQNYSGDVVGFTARVLDPNAKAAKYINSPETAIYNKSKVIFGLYKAKSEIRKQDCAIIVEGNMDVISCHQAGFKNAVGSSGTAFTEDQLSTLSRLTKNLKFAFDTDQAGAAATKRALSLALAQGFNVYIVKISGAKDPDELVKKNPKAFAQAVESAPLYLDYFFEKAFEKFDPLSVQQKKEIAAELVPMIAQLNDPLETAHYVRNLARMLAVEEKVIYELFSKPKNTKQVASQNVARSNTAPENEDVKSFRLVKPRSFYLDQKILGYALFNKKTREMLAKEIHSEDFQDPEIASEYQKLLEKPFENPDNKALSELAKMAVFVIESEYNQSEDSQAFEREFNQVLKDFKNNSLKIKMKNITTEMVLAEQRKDKQALAKLNQKFLELSRALNNEA